MEKKTAIGYRVAEDCQLNYHNFEAGEEIIIADHCEDSDWPGIDWYDKYPQIFEPIYSSPPAEGMAGEGTQENKAIQVLDWLADANNNGINNDPFLKIILCDGEYYWDTDNDGDQPISATDLYKLFIKNKYTQP